MPTSADTALTLVNPNVSDDNPHGEDLPGLGWDDAVLCALLSFRLAGIYWDFGAQGSTATETALALR